jgi:DUF971 family protein
VTAQRESTDTAASDTTAASRPTTAKAPAGGSSSGSPTAPLRMHADRAARTFAIDWADGHSSVYDFTALRWLCPCAYCRGEAGLPGWLDSAPTLSDEQTRMTDIHLVGNYAVSPHWGDGHSTGFYTFTLLRDRCPCPDDTARRASGAASSAGGPTGSGHQHE